MKQVIWCLGLGVACLGMAACGETSAGDSAQSAGGAGGSGSTQSAGGGGADEPFVGCTPACAEGQICSVGGACIASGSCAADADCSAGTVCDQGTSTCVPGGGCGAQEAVVQAIPPNLLIVLDRSCSMQNLVGDKTKWEVAVEALEELTTTYQGKIRFGLELFPNATSSACGQGDITLPVGEDNESSIRSILTSSLAESDPNYPSGPCVTNIDTAMERAASSESAFSDPERESFALLLTDGKQSRTCSSAGGDDGTTRIITDLRDSQGVPTFVVGFGSEQIDAEQLNVFADAGGVPSSDATNRYYLAEDQTSLAAALRAIAEKTLSCSFALEQTPPDPGAIYVFFNNDATTIPADPSEMDGWTYDAATNHVVFHGPACDSLRTGAVQDIDIVFGCNTPTPD